MSKRIIKKKFAEEELISFDLKELAGLMSLFANDLLFLHHHAVGDKFDTIHSITEGLYKKAIEHLDALSEQAIIWKENVWNYNITDPGLVELYGPVVEDDRVDWLMLINILDDKGNVIVDALRSVSEKYTSDVKSLIDEMVIFWNKEINYKNTGRLK